MKNIYISASIEMFYIFLKGIHDAMCLFDVHVTSYDVSIFSVTGMVSLVSARILRGMLYVI